MSIELKDKTGQLVSEQDIRDARLAVQAALLYMRRLPNELAINLPNVLRCLRELEAWRCGSDLPVKEATPQEKILLKTMLPNTATDVQYSLALVLLREAARLCQVCGADEVATKKSITDQCYEAIRALHRGSKD